LRSGLRFDEGFDSAGRDAFRQSATEFKTQRVATLGGEGVLTMRRSGSRLKIRNGKVYPGV
jgi:hypothetical protein